MPDSSLPALLNFGPSCPRAGAVSFGMVVGEGAPAVVNYGKIPAIIEDLQAGLGVFSEPLDPMNVDYDIPSKSRLS